jgi:hypothetical protein
MFAASAIASILLAAALVHSAIRKLGRREDVVRSYARVGVPENKLGLLAAILFAGAAGLLAGLFWAPLGIAAAIALTLYFAVAVGFHIRARDHAHMAVPLALALLAALTAALRAAEIDQCAAFFSRLTNG